MEDMREDLDDAYSCIQKLEQARITLNKLMGPEGVITQEERKKFNLGMPQNQWKKKKPMLVQGIERMLRQEGKLLDPNERRLNVGANPQGGQAGQPPAGGIAADSTQAQNNQYFYGNTGGGNVPGGKGPLGAVANPGKKQAGKGGAMDEANEDDFWYQAPKGSHLRTDGGSNYQGYVDSVG